MQHTSQETIDVISDFKYNSINKQYNLDYRSWRQNTASPFVFRYVGNTKEHIYVDGKGQPKPTALAAERKALAKVSEVLGCALLLLLLCEMLGGTVLIWILHLLGVNIRMDFLTFSMQGSQWSVMLVRAIADALKYFVTFAVLQHYFKLPWNIRCPLLKGGVPETLLAIGIAMASASVYCIFDAMTGTGTELAQRLFSYKDMAAVAAYAVFDIILISWMSQFLLMGFFFPILRQFGDRFAVITIASVSFLQPGSLPERIGICCVMLGAGYLMVKSGSIAKCMLMHTLYTSLCYSRLILVYTDHSGMSFGRFMLILLLTTLICGATYYLLRKRKHGIFNRGSYLPTQQKIMLFSETVTMLPWIGLALLCTVIQLFY